MSAITITDDMLQELSDGARMLDGNPEADLILMGCQYAPAELWILSGMLTGRGCQKEARLVATIAMERWAGHAPIASAPRGNVVPFPGIDNGPVTIDAVRVHQARDALLDILSLESFEAVRKVANQALLDMEGEAR